MAVLQTQPEIITLEQYEALPEEYRVEIFDGAIYDMASPSQEHQTILTELLVFIRTYLKKNGGNCQVFPVPFDVKLSDKPLTIVDSRRKIVTVNYFEGSILNVQYSFDSTIKVNISEDLYIDFSEITGFWRQ